MITAPVHKIIPFSSVDGPGNRTAIFLQGCNFDCKYCHNPETRALISPAAKNMTAAEVFSEVKKQMPYIRGITVSGGECTLYPAFLKELFILCKSAGLTTFIDSNGTYDFEKDPALLEVTDSVMLDIKAFDQKDHLAVTSCENDMVLKNAVFLASQDKLYEVRTVVVPELFDVKDTILKTAQLLSPFLKEHTIGYKIIAYRPMGVREKYSHYQIPSQAALESLAELLRSQGFQKITIL